MNTIKKSYIKPQTTFKVSPALMAAPLAFFSAATAAAAIAGAAVGAVATSKLMSVEPNNCQKNNTLKPIEGLLGA